MIIESQEKVLQLRSVGSRRQGIVELGEAIPSLNSHRGALPRLAPDKDVSIPSNGCDGIIVLDKHANFVCDRARAEFADAKAEVENLGEADGREELGRIGNLRHGREGESVPGRKRIRRDQ
jgi:hypothetical protein